MTAFDVQFLEIGRALASIEQAAGDPERAHVLEDELHRYALRLIANGCPTPDLVARSALKSEEIRFPRWTA